MHPNPILIEWPFWLFALCFAAGLAAVLIILLYPVLVRLTLAAPIHRSSHRAPTPQGGGAAVLIAILATVSLGVVSKPDFNEYWSQIAALMIAAGILGVVGFVDDVRNLAAWKRLSFHVAAVIFLIGSVPADIRPMPFLDWWSERSLLVLCGVWFVNLFNFMDGIDWMSVAEVVPICGGCFLIGSLGGLPPVVVLVAVAVFGATLGFAPFNRPVARLFLGDSGSLPLGLLIGWILILIAGNGYLVSAFLLPLYYLADATLTLLRRLLRGERFWESHRSHFYQRAMDNGFTVPAIVLRVFLLNVTLAALSIIAAVNEERTVQLVTLSGGLMLVSFVLIDFSRARG